MSAGRGIGLLLGVAADAVLGDPQRGHPVAVFGKLAQHAEKWFYRDGRVAGAAYTGVLVGGSVAAGALAQRRVRRVPVLEAVATGVATWAVLGGSSLAGEGAVMARALHVGDIESARQWLSHLCGREPARLDTQGLARASVESVAENTSDAVVAPLMWGAVAGIPGLVGYRAANTLDAMVGRRTLRYYRFGWASARLDDVLNLVPSRLSAALVSACAPLVGGSTSAAWDTWRRDASAHPSPNAGQVEAAFAGALCVRLGGCTVYGHGVEQRPVLGKGRTPEAEDVTRSVELSRMIGALAGGLAAAVVMSGIFRS